MRHVEVDRRLSVGSWPVAVAQIERARAIACRVPEAGLRPVALIHVGALDRSADPAGNTRILLALENLQVTGSFKVRGALTALESARSAGVAGVIAASAGNHGIGVARAARILGLQATVVVPRTASNAKTSRIRGEGAELVFCDGGYDCAERLAKRLAAEQGIPFVSPYDDIDVLTGNGSSLAFEIVEALGSIPDHVLVPIGGGGLATGMAWGLATCANEDPRQKRRVWTVQSEASPAFALSLERGHAVEELTPSSPTLAEGLEGGISADSFARVSSVVAGVSVLDEQRIAAAMKWAHSKLAVRLEGSAAAALVPALDGLPPLITGGDLVIVLTGRNVDDEAFEDIAVEAASVARLTSDCSGSAHRVLDRYKH